MTENVNETQKENNNNEKLKNKETVAQEIQETNILFDNKNLIETLDNDIKTQNNKESEKIVNVYKNVDDFESMEKVHAKQVSEVVFEALLPNMPKNLPTLEFEFVPIEPKKRYFTPELNNRLLTRRIYIEMLKAIKMYGKLENITPQSDLSTITSLKNQMEILSLAMLNIYGRTAQNNKVPFFTSGGSNISRNYKKALQQMYDKVYHIHNLVFRLLNKTTDNQIKSTLIIVYTNLKSQLQTLQTLINN